LAIIARTGGVFKNTRVPTGLIARKDEVAERTFDFFETQGRHTP
jgi:hypothetical protein